MIRQDAQLTQLSSCGTPSLSMNLFEWKTGVIGNLEKLIFQGGFKYPAFFSNKFKVISLPQNGTFTSGTWLLFALCNSTCHVFFSNLIILYSICNASFLHQLVYTVFPQISHGLALKIFLAKDSEVRISDDESPTVTSSSSMILVGIRFIGLF